VFSVAFFGKFSTVLALCFLVKPFVDKGFNSF